MKRLKTLLACPVALVAMTASPVEGQAPETPPARGQALYVEHCADCHGDRGRGDGPKSKRLGFRPRDLSLASFKCRCTPSGSLATDEDLLRTLEDGLPGTPMTGLAGKLSRDELLDVVAHIKTLSSRTSDEPVPECVTLPPDPGSSETLVAEGARVYRLLGCLQCHGPAGRGDGPSAEELRDDWGNEIRAYDFTKRRRFKCGAEPTDLYRTLHTGMNGSPMPSYAEAFLFAADPADAGSLEPDASELAGMEESERRDLVERRTWALVHYLLSLGEAPRE